MTRTPSERLAVIEEINLRIEAKLDAHIHRTERRLSHLERFRWYSTGAFTALFTGLIAYLKAHFPQ